MNMAFIDVAPYYQQLPHQHQPLIILPEHRAFPDSDGFSSNFVGFKTGFNSKENSQFFPEIEIISDRQQLRGEWGEKTYTIDVHELTVLVLDTYDLETGNSIDRELSGTIFVDAVVNPLTGHIVAAVELDYVASIITSGIFIIEPQAEGYAIYPVQVPGPKAFPNEFSTYGLGGISSLNFVEDTLLVTYSNAASNTSIMTFKPGNTPAMEYLNCVDVVIGEGGGLCRRVGK